MWIFRGAGYSCYEVGYYVENINVNTAGFRSIFTVDSMLKAMRLVNYLNGGDGTINSMIEDICNEERT